MGALANGGSISDVEKRFIRWAERNLDLILVIAALLLGIFVRVTLRRIESTDYVLYLSKWYDKIKAAGGFSGLGTHVGNYNLLYQTLIAAIGYLPIKSLYAYKILSCVFDLVLAWAAGKLASTSNSGFCRGYRFAAAFGLVFLSPIVVLNSAGWAQCDSMWTSMCLLTLALLKERKPVAAMAAYGLAFAFKLQAIFLLPVIIYLWAKERTFSLLLLLEVPLVMVVTAIPALIAGRNVADILFIYDYQASHSKNVSMNYPSLWRILFTEAEAGPSWGGSWYPVAKGMMLGVAAYALFLEACILYRKGVSIKSVVPLAATLTYTLVNLLPAMHERYAYLSEVLLLIAVVQNMRFLPSAFVAHFLTLATYGFYLFGAPKLDYKILGTINCLNAVLLFVVVLWVCGQLGPGKRERIEGQPS